MLSCTCAGLLSHDEFLRMIYARPAGGAGIAPATEERGARHAARHVQILAKTGAAADHPVATNCPETEYCRRCLCGCCDGRRGSAYDRAGRFCILYLSL